MAAADPLAVSVIPASRVAPVRSRPAVRRSCVASSAPSWDRALLMVDRLLPNAFVEASNALVQSWTFGVAAYAGWLLTEPMTLRALATVSPFLGTWMLSRPLA